MSSPYGYLYLAIFIILSTIVMLNLLIALLANIYDSVNKTSNSLYLNQMIKINHSISQHKTYSCLSYSYIPINLITTLLLPLILIFKSQKLNSILLLLSYIPVMIVGVILFSLCSNVLVPFSYLIILKAKVRKLFDAEDSARLSSRIRSLVKFIFFGVLGLIKLSIYDTVYFSISLFDTDLKLRNPKTEDDDIVSRIDSSFLEYFIKLLEVRLEIN